MILNANSEAWPGYLYNFICLIVATVITQEAEAQTVPTNMLDFTVEDLLLLDVFEEEATTELPWSLSYTYYHSRFDGYRDGSDRVSNEDVLFRPGEEQRSGKNYPVVPTDIEQELHSVILAYEFDKRFSLSTAFSYIRQSTDHISVVPNYDQFIIKSEGIGDVTIAGHYSFPKSISGRWKLGLGVSIPTGSIDEEGDTPRAPGDQILPYTMQIGSGTYDIPLYVSYRGYDYLFDWGLTLSAKIRTGKNDRSYRLGNTYTSTAWLTLKTLPYIQPTAGISYRHLGDFHGEDDSLKVPGRYPYPAPVVNPKSFGGEVFDLSIGVKIPLLNPSRHIDVQFSKPVSQSLNGPQSSRDYRFSISLHTQF